MKKYVKVYFTFYEELANSELKKKEKELRNRLKKYKVGNGGILGDYYKLSNPSEQLSDFLEFCENKKYIDMHIEYINEYTDEELMAAKIFLVKPKKMYMHNKELFKYVCESCSCLKLEDNEIDIKLGKKISGKNAIFKLGEGMEEIPCVSTQVFDILINNGVCSNYFKKIVNKDVVVGYAINPQNVCDFISDSYIYSICKQCGRIYAENDRKKDNLPEIFKIRENDINLSCDVYYTKQYYFGERWILISPRIRNLIKDYVKKEELIPIFETI